MIRFLAGLGQYLHFAFRGLLATFLAIRQPRELCAQLYNVFLGQMSLVGPRPLPVYEVENFSNPAQRRRLSVKPGITCLWQISGRNELKEFETWVKLDLKYIDNWSIWLDLKILIWTIPAVLFGVGAK